MIFVIIGIAPLFVLAGVPSPLLAQEQSRLPIIDMHLHADLLSEDVRAGAGRSVGLSHPAAMAAR